MHLLKRKSSYRIVGIDQGKRIMKANGVSYEDNETTVLALPYLSKLKRRQQALEQKVRDLKTRNDELNAFVQIVAHELKNPLSSMIGFASLVDQYHDRM